jgi:alkylmercury lyase
VETISPGGLADQLITVGPALAEREQHLAITLYRLLAEGEPVGAPALADRAAMPRDEVERTLSEWGGIFTDEQANVIGFLGLSIRPMPHRLTVAGRTLYAWCAFDALFLPELLDATAQVESRFPTTGEQITLTVTGTEVSNLRPEATVLSYLHKDKPLDQHVINTFCHFIHFFADPAAADEWTAQRDGTFTISVADGREIARLVNRGRYPSIVTD